MKVSELKLACEDFLLEHADTEVKLLWEEGVISENYDPECLEDPTDVRVINDWPLPGDSIITKNESPSKMFVIMYGEYNPSGFGYKAVAHLG
jgi:hypothetical protein